MIKRKFASLLLIPVVLLAFFVRTYNVNWDEGAHIHPDERFLTMVVNDMRVPKTLADYLDPQVSTMNPHNINYGFFVYGTFPLYLVKFLAIFLKMDNYSDITLLGRVVSAIFDTGVVIILYFLTKLLLNLKFDLPALLRKTLQAGIRNSKKIPNSKIQKNNHNNLTIQQFNNRFSWAPLLPPFLYSIMVLPIQLSHFFASDTFLVFFMIASFYISVLIRQKIIERKSWNKIFYLSILLGITIGLGLASKITMIFIIPLDLLVIFSSFFICRDKPPGLSANQCGTTRRSSPTTKKIYDKRQIVELLIYVSLYSCIPIFVSSYFFFRMAMPMAFLDSNFLNFSLNPKWIKNISDLQTMSSYSLANTFPPSIQWFTTQPILFPLKNMILWGMGIPMAIICAIALIFSLKNVIPAKAGIQTYLLNLISPISLLSFFTLAFFLYQGSQFVKPLRYIYPIYWCFALIGGLFISQIIHKFQISNFKFQILLIALLVYPFSFLQIYTRPHTRVEASRWMFDNLPTGAKVTFEEWDDPLPLLIDGHINEFPGTPLPMFWPDSEEKWNKITGIISETDYIILSSNRVYGSIPKRPDLYPRTKKYYELLFGGKLGFEKIAQFTSRPRIPFLNYEFVDDFADETFTVYDHPRVLIYRNVAKFNKEKLLDLISR